MGRPAPSTAPAGSQTAHLPVTGDTALELKALVWEQPAEDKAERTPGGVTGRAVGGAPGTGGKGAAGAPWGGEWRPQFCFPPVLAPLQGRPPSRTSLTAPLSALPARLLFRILAWPLRHPILVAAVTTRAHCSCQFLRLGAHPLLATAC